MLKHGSLTSRGLAITILIIGMATTSQLTIVPVITFYNEHRIRILDAVALLERYQAIIAKQPNFEEQTIGGDEDMLTETVYLDGSTTALAGAGLQDQIRHAIEAAGSEIRSIEVLPAIVVEDRNDLYRVGLRVRFTTTIASLPVVLFDLESGNPYLFVERLAITTEANHKSGGQSEEASDLDVRLDIFGFLPK